jgi:hypothetical protein
MVVTVTVEPLSVQPDGVMQVPETEKQPADRLIPLAKDELEFEVLMREPPAMVRPPVETLRSDTRRPPVKEEEAVEELVMEPEEMAKPFDEDRPLAWRPETKEEVPVVPLTAMLPPKTEEVALPLPVTYKPPAIAS